MNDSMALKQALHWGHSRSECGETVDRPDLLFWHELIARMRMANNAEQFKNKAWAMTVCA
jgi:hypothetical protein